MPRPKKRQPRPTDTRAAAFSGDYVEVHIRALESLATLVAAIARGARRHLGDQHRRARKGA